MSAASYRRARTRDPRRQVRQLARLEWTPNTLHREQHIDRGAVCARRERALADAALPVVAVNPRAVRHFAKAIGVLAKTDRLDAAVLTQYAATLKPNRPRPRAADHPQRHGPKPHDVESTVMS